MFLDLTIRPDGESEVEVGVEPDGTIEIHYPGILTLLLTDEEARNLTARIISVRLVGLEVES